jgi:hypothetical protein
MLSLPLPAHTTGRWTATTTGSLRRPTVGDPRENVGTPPWYLPAASLKVNQKFMCAALSDAACTVRSDFAPERHRMHCIHDARMMIAGCG